jgi:hypothetical protein
MLIPLRNKIEISAGAQGRRASPSEVPRIILSLAQLLDFLLALPYPRIFLGDTKFLVTPDAVTMRGRDAATREIKPFALQRE